MKMQVSPNWWSCLATSFGIALNIPVRELIKEIGHNGSEIVFPNVEEPFCRRGFHVQEFVVPCLKRKIALVIVECTPTIECDSKIYDVRLFENRINDFTKMYEGVLVGGENHAVAWDRKICMDPNNKEYSIEYFNVKEFYAFVKAEHL